MEYSSLVFANNLPNVRPPKFRATAMGELKVALAVSFPRFVGALDPKRLKLSAILGAAEMAMAMEGVLRAKQRYQWEGKPVLIPRNRWDYLKAALPKWWGLKPNYHKVNTYHVVTVVDPGIR